MKNSIFKRLLLIAVLLSVVFFVSYQVSSQNIPGPLWLGTKSLPAEFFTEIAKNNVPGHSYFHQFGKGVVGTTMTPVASSLKYPTPTSAVLLEVVSSDANDTAAGTGARSVSIQGLDENWDLKTQTVATNGLTPVPFPLKMLRVFRWWVVNSGTYADSSTGSHAGTITIQTSPGAVLWFNGVTTPYPKGQSEIAGYTVPDGFRAYVYLHSISVDSTKSTDIVFIRRLGADTVTAPYTPMRAITEYVAVSGSLSPQASLIPIDGEFPARTDLLWLAKTSVGTASVSILYDILLVEDGY